MAWPDFPPPAQLDAYNAGLSGDMTTEFTYRGADQVGPQPVEYADYDPYTDWAMKAGYFTAAELDVWLADNPPGEPDPPSGDGAAVAAFLGAPDDADVLALAAEHLPIVTALARSYTRSNGFLDGAPNEEIAAVITVATARMMTNPGGIAYQVGETAVRGSFTGWSLAETFVLNRFRKRAR